MYARSNAVNTSGASKATTRGADLPPGTQLYMVYVTDKNDDSQIQERRIWLEGIVKDKTRLSDYKIFPDVPEDELQKLYDSGKWEEKIDNY